MQATRVKEIGGRFGECSCFKRASCMAAFVRVALWLTQQRNELHCTVETCPPWSTVACLRCSCVQRFCLRERKLCCQFCRRRDLLDMDLPGSRSTVGWSRSTFHRTCPTPGGCKAVEVYHPTECRPPPKFCRGGSVRSGRHGCGSEQAYGTKRLCSPCTPKPCQSWLRFRTGRCIHLSQKPNPSDDKQRQNWPCRSSEKWTANCSAWWSTWRPYWGIYPACNWSDSLCWLSCPQRRWSHHQEWCPPTPRRRPVVHGPASSTEWCCRQIEPWCC